MTHPKGLLQTSDDTRAKHPLVKEETSKPAWGRGKHLQREMFLWGLRDSALAERPYTHTHTPRGTQPPPTVCGHPAWTQAEGSVTLAEGETQGKWAGVVVPRCTDVGRCEGQPAAVPCPHALPLPDLLCPAQRQTLLPTQLKTCPVEAQWSETWGQNRERGLFMAAEPCGEGHRFEGTRGPQPEGGGDPCRVTGRSAQKRLWPCQGWWHRKERPEVSLSILSSTIPTPCWGAARRPKTHSLGRF